MTTGFALVCTWVVAAWALSLLPSKRKHWPLAYVLIVAGLPILGLVYVQSGLGPALLALFVGALVLRWPVRYLWRWVLKVTTGRESPRP